MSAKIGQIAKSLAQALLTIKNDTNWERGLSILALGVFCFGILFSVFGVHGFMREHLGWMSPHLLGASINIEYTRIIAAERVYPDGTIASYGHHPPFSFYFFFLVSQLGVGFLDKLVIAHTASSVVYLAGWVVLYRVLCRLNIDPLIALFSILVVSSAELFLTYRALVSFDTFSIISGACLLYGLSEFERHEEGMSPRTFLIALSLCVFGVLISYYSYPILAAFFLSLFIFRLLRKKHWQQVFLAGAIIVVFMMLQGAWTILIHLRSDAGDSIGLFFNRVATDQVANIRTHLQTPEGLWSDHKKQFSRLMPSFVALVGVVVFVASSLGVSFVSRLLDKSEKRPEVTIRGDIPKIPGLTLISFVVGLGTFLYVGRYWAAGHPFTLLFLAAPLSLMIAVLLQTVKPTLRLATAAGIALLSVHSATLFAEQRNLDLVVANDTRGLIELIDEEFPSAYFFPTIKRCGRFNFNNGMQKLLFSAPNLWTTNEVKIAADRDVLVECADPKTGAYRFRTRDGKREYIFTPGHAGYIIIQDE